MATPVMNTNLRNSEDSRNLAKLLIDRYYRTTEYPYTNHHIASYDQFIYKDLLAIIKGQNPIVILKDILDEKRSIYRYKAEIFIGGFDGANVYIGAPTISLQNGNEVRLLFPNEARLRNLSYASNIYADISVRITLNSIVDGELADPPQSMDINYEQFPLCQLPIMLHSSYCLLNGKPKDFLQEVGECPNDHGGYFIIDGSEKVLITSQEQAFNTLYISNKPRDAKVSAYANIYCLSPKTRQVKMVSFSLLRQRYSPPVKGEEDKKIYQGETIVVSLPMVRKPIPIFVLFRAMGIQTDEDIVNTIFPDKDGAEAQLLRDKLIPSILEAAPFMNKYTAIRYIKVLTKGFSVEHVIDVIRNQMFIHVDDSIPGARASFLGDCVRAILRVAADIDPPTDKDDIRNQRCLTSGFLTQMLFFGAYRRWIKSISLAISSEYNYNKTLYEGENFKYLFSPGNFNSLFRAGQITEDLMKGFKGKWGGGLGEEKAGVLQALSRLSYLDFMSHCRRVVSDFDTSLKLTGPRHLHTSQYGYFCTNETPGGASIGITKNLSVMTQISTSITNLDDFTKWIRTKGGVLTPNEISMDLKVIMIPVYINGGIIGYTSKPQGLLTVLRLMKHTGFLPYSTSITFNIRTKRLIIYVDEGRPLRPLIILDNGKLDKNRISSFPTWRDLIIGTHPERRHITLKSSDFTDPLASKPTVQIEDYIAELGPHRCALEYVDPYEHNETFIANFESHIRKGETTHLEVHPSTMLSILTSLIPFPNHNQSPRNQLSDSQSKQGVSLYATNWKNRYDNNAHVLCYGETPLSRTIYTDYLGEGKMPYGQNIVVAIAAYTGYNQEDGIVINKDALDRGLFRTSAYKSYEAFEEDDSMSRTTIRFGNPAEIPVWMHLRPGLDYSKLDKDGFIKVGEYVDENTVIVGAYMIGPDGEYKDASVTPQVWTYGRVESLVTTVNNIGLRLTKIRVVQDRIPVLGDKFSNRHGQKGTIGMIVRGCDMPRTINGVVPDIIMNPHCLAEDHEILTEKGFMNWEEIKKHYELKDLRLAGYDHTTGNIVYEQPTNFIFNEKKEYDMIDFTHIGESSRWGNAITDKNSNGVSLLVTTDHDMFAKKGRMYGESVTWDGIQKGSRGESRRIQKDYEKIKAIDLIDDKKDIIKFIGNATNGILNGLETLPFANELELDTFDKINVFCELYGYWLGDGCLKFGGNSIEMSPVKIADDEWIRKRFNILSLEKDKHYTYNIIGGQSEDRPIRYRWSIIDKKWFNLFCSEYGRKYKKYHSSSNVPEVTSEIEHENIKSAKWMAPWVWNISTELSRSILAGLRFADGCEKADRNVIWTSSVRFRDEIQRLAFHAGYSSHFIIQHNINDICGKDTNGTDIIARHISWKVTYSDNKRSAEPILNINRDIKKTKYNGITWCVTMPHGFIITRRAIRNNKGEVIQASKPIITGQCIPSRMTMGQILEQLLGKLVTRVGALGDATAFMNEGSPVDMIGNLLEQMGTERYGNEILYNGMTGTQTDSYIFVGQLYSMRLKHMVEDKWQARGKGRREQKTHQPTGGRGNQGGLKIGEQERDSISCHGAALFLRESFMERSDGTEFPVCIGCGTIPIYNPKLNIAICSLCDGPVKFSGNTANNLEIIPPSKKPTADIVKVEVPYSFKLLNQELGTFMNMFMRIITTRGVDKIRGINIDKVAGMVEIKNLQDINERYIPELPVSKPQEKSEEAPPVEELESMANSINMTLVPKSSISDIAETGQLVFDTMGDEADKGIAVGAEAEGLEGPIEQDDFEEFDIRDPMGTMGMPSFASSAFGQQQQQPRQSQLPNTAMMGTQYPFIPMQPPIPPQGIVPPQPMQQYQAATPSAGPTLVVDTSPNAMASMGLPSVEQTAVSGQMGGYMQFGMQQPRQRAPRRRQQPRWGGEYEAPGGYMSQQQQQQQQPQQQQQQQREYAGIGQGYSGPVSVKKSE